MKKLWPLGILMMAVLLAALTASPVYGGNHDGKQDKEKVPVFIGFKDPPGEAEKEIVRKAGGTIKYTYKVVRAIAAAVPREAIEGLSKNPKVKYIEQDIEVRIVDHATTPGDAELNNTWGVKHIGAGAVHNNGNKGTGVKVAVLDTGIDTDHPDVKYDATCSNSTSYPSVEDGHGHGTHVSGTIAALDNGAGVVGVAPEAIICAFKVLSDSGGGSYSDVVAALNFIFNFNNNSANATSRIRVTNNSYGSSGDPGQTVKDAFDNTYAAGVLHVAAAGNSGNAPGKGDNCIFPAKWDSLIATGATNQDDTRAKFSSTCAELELAAPGVGINSTTNNGSYGLMSGTSMASPHVAGTAALVIKDGTTAVGDVRLRLGNTADDLGDPGRDTKYGFGLVDANEAASLNKAPTASGVSTSTNEDTAVTITLSGSDPETCDLTFSIVTGPGNGALSGITNNACTSGSPNSDTASVSYTPEPNFNGSDSFTYKVNDGITDSNTATVSITVNPVNDAPVANNQSVITEKNTIKTINLTGADVDGCAATTFSYAVTSGPTNGTVSATSGAMTCSGSGSLAASVDYSPKSDFVGDDSFKFTISDGSATSIEATVSISVTQPNTAPTANNVSTITNEDTAVAITLSGSDPETCHLTFTIVAGPGNGALSGISNNACSSGTPNTDSATVTYTPKLNFNGTDSFTYKVNDGAKDSNTATVSITVNAVNDAPVAADKSASTTKGTSVDITLTASDVDNCELSITIVTIPSNGSLSGITGNACVAGSPNTDSAKVTYTPNSGFTGNDSFTYKANDGSADSNTATVSITVTSPVVFADNFEGTINWTANGLWHLADGTGCIAPDNGYTSATHSFYYGKEATCNYNTGGSNSGNLTSSAISGLVTGTDTATLSFQFWREVELYTAGSFDRTYVRVSYNGGGSWTTVWFKDSKTVSEKAWTLASVSLSPTSDKMLVSFVFNTVDGIANSYRGWLIDDVKVENK